MASMLLIRMGTLLRRLMLKYEEIRTFMSIKDQLKNTIEITVTMQVDLQLKAPSCIIVSGSSNCGKTYLIEKLLSNHETCFEKPIEELYWVYAKHTRDEQLFQRLQGLNMPVEFHEGYPKEKLSENTLFTKPTEAHKCLVLDDIFTGPSACTSLFDMFNIISHHQNITCIVVVQNLQGSTLSQKGCLSTLLRSTTYLVLFVNRRMIPIVRYIAQTFYPGEGNKVIEPLNSMLKSKKPHGYLLFDFISDDEVMQVREGGLVPGENCYGFQFPI